MTLTIARPNQAAPRFLLGAIFFAVVAVSASSARAWSTWSCPGNPAYRVTWPNDQVWPIRFMSNTQTGSWLHTQTNNAMYDWNSIYGAYDQMSIAGTGYGYCTSSDDEGFGVLGWDNGACHSWGANERGVTRVWTDNCLVSRMSVYFNTNAPFAGDDDLRYVALHELGHYLGGDHSWNELSVMGYSDGPPMPFLAAPDHELLRFLYGSGNSTLPDFYLTRLGVRDVVIPGSASFTELAAPVCSGSCFDLQVGDTVSIEVTYGSAGTQSFSDVPIRMFLGSTVLGEWTWSGFGGEAQSQTTLVGTVPFGAQPGSFNLEVWIDPDDDFAESSGPTPGNSVSVPGFAISPPAGWTCDDASYADGFYCDCACGVLDADCDGQNPVLGCATEECMTTSCSAAGTCLLTANQDVCSDGQFCTAADQCSLGACEPGPPRDCSFLDGPCTQGSCHEDIDACLAEPVREGELCDDGNFCTVATMCADGACEGEMRDCSGLDSVCTVGVCDEAADSCVPDPANEGGSCDDGNPCTLDDACALGGCTGVPKDCSALAGPCQVAFCDAATGECVVEDATDGTPCDDGAFCTDGDTCQAGAWTGGPPLDCSGLDSFCGEGFCDEGEDACRTFAVHESESCDDGSLCTQGDRCLAGSCVGTPLDCSGLDEACLAGVCDLADGTCVTEPANQAAVCDDADPCTKDDRCTASGLCAGVEKDCSGLDGACASGACDEGTGACIAVDRVDGSACDDGDACISGSVCTDGVCAGGEPGACAEPDPMPDDDDGDSDAEEPARPDPGAGGCRCTSTQPSPTAAGLAALLGLVVWRRARRPSSSAESERARR